MRLNRPTTSIILLLGVILITTGKIAIGGEAPSKLKETQRLATAGNFAKGIEILLPLAEKAAQSFLK